MMTMIWKELDEEEEVVVEECLMKNSPCKLDICFEHTIMLILRA